MSQPSHCYTDEFLNFTNSLNMTKGSWKHENGNYYMVYYELDGLSGEELENHCKKNEILHPVLMDDKNRKQYLRQEIISIPSKVCHCCS